MGLTDSDTTPDKKGIVRKARVLDNALSGGKSKVVAIADDKVFKDILGMKIVGGTDGSGGLIGKQRGRRGGFRNLNWFLNDEVESIVSLGLIVESTLKKTVIALKVHVGRI